MGAEERVEVVNNAVKSGRFSSVRDLSKELGISIWTLYHWRSKGLFDLPKCKRGPIPCTKGRIAENLGIIEMLGYMGCPLETIASQIEEGKLTRQAIHWYFNRPENKELYGTWRRNREK